MFLPDVEIVHYGGVSTRQHFGYAASNRLTGYAHLLRKSGCSRVGVLAYKLAVTVDAPIEMLLRGTQYLIRAWRGQTDAAQEPPGLCGCPAFLDARPGELLAGVRGRVSGEW